MNDTVNEKFDLDSLNADLNLLLTNDGYEILIEDVLGSELQKYDGTSNYVRSLLDAINEGCANGVVRTEVKGSYAYVPDKVAVKLVVLLRAHGVTLKRQHIRNSTDFVYWGQRQIK